MYFLKRVKIVCLIFQPLMRCYAIIALSLWPMLCFGQNFQCQWAHVAGKAAQVIPTSQDVDASGNVYITGFYWNNNLIFDDSMTTLGPNPDTTKTKIFIAKYAPDGHLLWTKAFESGFAQSMTITADDQDNIYLTGGFIDYITFGTLTLTQSPASLSISGSASFIAKFDATGQLLWAKNDPAGYVISHDGRIALYGSFFVPSLTLEPNVTLTNSDSSGQTNDFLVGEMDNNGNLLWVKSYGRPGENDEIDYVAFSPNDELYVSGLFDSTLSLEGITLNSVGNISSGAKNWFIAGYDMNGDVPWAIRGGISNIAPLQLYDGAPKIKTDQYNNLYFAGVFHRPTMQVDSLILNGNGVLSGSVFANNIDNYWYAGKCNDKGLLWAKSGNSPVRKGLYLTPGRDGGLYLAGTFRDTAIFGNVTLNSTDTISNHHEGFVAKLNSMGQVSWAKHFGPLLKETIIFDMVADQNNTLDVLGSSGDYMGLLTSPPLNFDTIVINSVNGSRDYFLARYKDNGDILSVSDIGGPGIDGTMKANLDLSGPSGLYVSGEYRGAPLTLDTITSNFPGNENYFVAKYDENVSNTGLNRINALNDLYVYPNPTTGLLYLNAPEGLTNIRIFNVTGQEVYRQALAASPKVYSLNLRRFPDGIYWLKMGNRGESVIRKIVLRK